MAEGLTIIGYIIGSILSSCSIIMVNKHIMANYPFRWPITLTAWHMVVTLLGLECMIMLKWIKRADVPAGARWFLGGSSVAAIVFMNFNLRLNSVGFYQLSKLMVIPAVLFYALVFENKRTGMQKCCSLAIQMVGAALFSVNDVQFNVAGAIVALIAVVCVAVNQSRQGSIQKEFGISGFQATHTCAMPQLVLCILSAVVYEFPGHNSVLQHRPVPMELFWIFLTGVIAVSTNICGFGLIGKTSPVTYQVVGIAKSCLIFTGGLILFPAGASETTSRFVKKVMGLVIAMSGVVYYAVLEVRERTQAALGAPAKVKEASSHHGEDRKPLLAVGSTGPDAEEA